VGVEEDQNTIVGDDFLTIAVSKSCKRLSRKSLKFNTNVPFPNLKDKVVGLVTIKPKNKISCFKKIHTIP
jgi:hypothetical protein